MSGLAYRIIAVVALALLAGVLIMVAVILLARGNNTAPIQIIAPASSGAAGPVAASPPGADTLLPSSTLPDDLRVYIHGAVRSPGVYPLQPGDRIYHALEAAGGATDEADLAAVNLAQRVQDEGYYYIPKAGETPPPVAASLGQPASSSLSAAPGGASNGLINLNTASLDVLESLPGIGEAKAQAIIDYREQKGPFASVEQVMEVSGIGERTYENIRDLVTVGGQ